MSKAKPRRFCVFLKALLSKGEVLHILGGEIKMERSWVLPKHLFRLSIMKGQWKFGEKNEPHVDRRFTISNDWMSRPSSSAHMKKTCFFISQAAGKAHRSDLRGQGLCHKGTKPQQKHSERHRFVSLEDRFKEWCCHFSKEWCCHFSNIPSRILCFYQCDVWFFFIFALHFVHSPRFQGVLLRSGPVRWTFLEKKMAPKWNITSDSQWHKDPLENNC